MGCKTNTLNDFFKSSAYRMADISGKAPTFRRAIAIGRIAVGEIAFTHIQNGTLPKGDVLKLAEVAGITGAKNASQTMPLCHPLLLDHVAVHLDLEAETHCIVAYCVVSTIAKTGVEMEALAGVNAALLTVYDLTKPVEPALTIKDIRLLLKEGGKKGLWLHPEGIPDNIRDLMPTKSKQPLQGIKAAVVTMSDRASQGVYEDKSGKRLQDALVALGAEIVDYTVLPDDKKQLEEKLIQLSDAEKVNLVITTGGTGLAPRDITPDVLASIADKEIAGIGERLRSHGAQFIPQAWLSRSLAVARGQTLLLALPGSSNAVVEGMQALTGLLPHALELLVGKSDHASANKSHSH